MLVVGIGQHLWDKGQRGATAQLSDSLGKFLVWEEGWYFDLEGGEQRGFSPALGHLTHCFWVSGLKLIFISPRWGPLAIRPLETMYSFSSDVFWIDKTVQELGPLREAASVWLLRVHALVGRPCL